MVYHKEIKLKNTNITAHTQNGLSSDTYYYVDTCRPVRFLEMATSPSTSTTLRTSDTLSVAARSDTPVNDKTSVKNMPEKGPQEVRFFTVEMSLLYNV